MDQPPSLPDTRASKKLESNAGLALAAAVIIPLFSAALIVFSFGLIIAAFVIGIVIIVRGRILSGAIIIGCCPIVLIAAFTMASLALEPGTWREKAERWEQAGKEDQQKEAEDGESRRLGSRRSQLAETPEPTKTREEILKHHEEVLRKAGIEPDR